MFTRIGAGEIVFLSVIVLIGLIGTLAFVGLFLNSRRERMLKHAERMKALELGRELPETVATEPIPEVAVPKSPPQSEASQFAGQCFSTAFWACFWGFLFAGQSGMNGPNGSHAVAMMIAGAAGAVGVTAVICGTILASKAVAIAPVPSPSPVPSGYAAKPRFDREEV